MHDGDHRQVVSSPQASAHGRQVLSATQPTNLADLLERVLDKGIVIAGDITLSLGNVEFLKLKIRLLIASIDKAQEIGINWWQFDPALSSQARAVEAERDELKERLDRLEARLEARLATPSGDAAEEPSADQPAERPRAAASPRPRTSSSPRRKRQGG